MAPSTQVSRKTFATTPVVNLARDTVIASSMVVNEDDITVEIDRFQAELHKRYDLDENEELKPPKAKALDEADISPEKIRSECERVFFYRNENPRPVWSHLFIDHFYERKRDWRLLGWYFRECGMAGQKIGIEIKAHDSKRQVLLAFPSTVNPFQRKSAIQLVQSLVGENYKVIDKNKMSKVVESVTEQKANKVSKKKMTNNKEVKDTTRNTRDTEPEDSFGSRLERLREFIPAD